MHIMQHIGYLQVFDKGISLSVCNRAGHTTDPCYQKSHNDRVF